MKHHGAGGTVAFVATLLGLSAAALRRTPLAAAGPEAAERRPQDIDHLCALMLGGGVMPDAEAADARPAQPAS